MPFPSLLRIAAALVLVAITSFLALTWALRQPNLGRIGISSVGECTSGKGISVNLSSRASGETKDRGRDRAAAEVVVPLPGTLYDSRHDRLLQLLSEMP